MFECLRDVLMIYIFKGITPPQLLKTRDGSSLAPAMNPQSPWLVAHAARGDLWVTSRRVQGCPLRLTYACRGLSRYFLMLTYLF